MIANGKIRVTYPSRNTEITIWNLSDLHLMSRYCAEDKIKEDVERIRSDPTSFWLSGGDIVDMIDYDDKRFDADSVDPRVEIKDLGNIAEIAHKTAYDILSPIKHKCLGMCMGNHELKHMIRNKNKSWHSWLCAEMGAPDLGYCGMFHLIFQRTRTNHLQIVDRHHKNKGGVSSFTIFIHHGSGFATSPGGKLNKLIQFMNNFDADIYFLGHVHDQLGRRQVIMGIDGVGTNLIYKTKLGVISGSYLKTYTKGGMPSYGEQRGYAPTNLGASFVKIKPFTGEMRGEI